ncbi:MAG: DsbA family protein [Candidatus Daviesbacteria bacterium]|nr:DsbA family protein [Candidatus Daviesbacteria bacterium]
MDQKPFLTSPVAILIGSIVIAVAILISGGVIPVKLETKGVKGVATVTPTPSTQAQPTQAPISLAQIKDSFNKALIKFGDSNNKLVAIEISDPSCPYCQAAAGQNSALNKQMGSKFTLVKDGGTYVAPVAEIEKLVQSGKASFAWIYFPGHGAGEMGTKAFYCAFEKGKFWEVHNLLMSEKGYDLLNNTVKNDKTKSGDMAAFLTPVFDPTAMKACLDSGKYDNQLQTDQTIASGLNIQGTPSFYLNTINYPGAVPYSAMEATINAALK